MIKSWLRQSQGLLSQISAAFLVKSSGAVLALTVQIWFARVMGVEQFGVYVLVFSWVTVIATFSNFGMHLPIIRFVSKYVVGGNYPLLRGMLLRFGQLVMVASLVLVVFYLLVVTLVSDGIEPNLYKTLMIAVWAIPLTALTQTGRSFMFAFKRSAIGLVPELLIRPLFIMIGIIIVFQMDKELSAPNAMILMTLGSALALMTTYFLVNQSLPTEAARCEREFDMLLWIRTAPPFLIVAVAELLISRTDILVLGILRSTSEVGIYASANLLVAATSMMTNSIEGAVAPRFAEHFAKGDTKAIQLLLTRVVWGSTAILLPIASICLLYGDWMLLIFGRDFSSGGVVLIILVFGRVIAAAIGPMGMIMGISGEQRRLAIWMIVAGVLNVVIAFSLIPFLGIEGAAFAQVAILILYTLVLGYLVWSRLGVMPSVFAPWLIRLSAK